MLPLPGSPTENRTSAPEGWTSLASLRGIVDRWPIFYAMFILSSIPVWSTLERFAIAWLGLVVHCSAFAAVSSPVGSRSQRVNHALGLTIMACSQGFFKGNDNGSEARDLTKSPGTM